MGLIDRFLNAIKLNDDFDDDDDFLDDDDEANDLDDEEVSRSKKKRFFSRFSADDDDDDPDDEPPVTSRSSERRTTERKYADSKPSSSYRSSSSASSIRPKTSQSPVSSARTVSYASRPSSVRDEREKALSSDTRKKQPKVTPIREESSLSNMEVNVIRPSSMEDTRDIADTLLQNCTVVLNLEGLDVDIAQRVIDFTCGVCYSLNGNLQKVSSYIFILTPENVELSGDFQSILSGAFDLAPMRSGF